MDFEKNRFFYFRYFFLFLVLFMMFIRMIEKHLKTDCPDTFYNMLRS